MKEVTCFIMSCDLHVHTNASDGLLAPEKVIHLAKEIGLEAVAITDHDTTAAIGRAASTGKVAGVEVVPGIEISTEWQEEEIHILGYYLDYGLAWLQERLAKRREGRMRRAQTIVGRLRDLGLEIDWDRVLALAGGAAVGRPHIAMAMMEKDYVGSIEEAFRRYLDRGAPAYVPRTPLTPQQAVALIRAAGGVPVLAHPGLIRKRALVQELLATGVIGLEVFYPEHDEATVAWLLGLVSERGLIATGGSDFHGYEAQGYAPLGACRVPSETLVLLRNAARALTPWQGRSAQV